jgi:Ion channel
MHIFALIGGAALIFAILRDAFETVVLPRRVERRFRLTNFVYRRIWTPWRGIASHINSQARREALLGYFGPLSILLLLMVWAAGLILGYALMQRGGGQHVQLSGEPITFGLLLYHSGETFFTLGYGDITPTSSFSRALSVLESGMGFGFLAVVIGYLPTIYSAFSRREIEISLLDARAGSPPTAAELLARFGKHPQQAVLDDIFRDWEQWAAQVLESHISYPVLSFFRSQHYNQSWLGALTTILDSSALVIAGIENVRSDQAKLTFAMARHAVVDLAQVVRARYDTTIPDRFSEEELTRVRQLLSDRGLKLRDGGEFEDKLAHLRSLYEPYVQGMARNLLITLPPWIHAEKKKDNWEAGPWDRLIQAKGLAVIGRKGSPHFADDHF